MAALPILRKRGTPTIFGELDEKNITFLIDTSGSMYNYMEMVKEHLVEVLLSRSFQRSDCHFNIIEFSDQVSPWADRMVKLTPQTVTVAKDWINKVISKSGSNMLDALLLAFSDPGCESVYLVTDGLPHQQPSLILQQVALASQGRPVHAILLTGTHADTAAYDFLENLAIQTAGTFNVISTSRFGQVERVEAVIRTDHARERLVTNVYEFDPEPVKTRTVITTLDNPPVTSVKTYDREDAGVENTSIKTTIDKLPVVSTTTYIDGGEHKIQPDGGKTCSVTTSLDHNPYLEGVYVPPDEPGTIVYTTEVPTKYPNIAWHTVRPHRFVDRVVVDDEKFSITGASLMTGMRVLSRRDKDGYYYPGSIKQQVTVSRRFLVEFDEIPGGGKHQTRLQETAVFDIIAYDDALRHTVVPGDKVLAPWEKDGVRYGPGTVLEGVEGRLAGDAADSDFLVVNFFNGMTVNVPKQTALWVPLQLYDRISLELQMPSSARAYIQSHPAYPYVSSPGYPVVTVVPEPPDYETVARIRRLQQKQVVIPVHREVDRVYVVPRTLARPAAVSRDDVERLIPGTNMTKEELNQKVMRQLVHHKMIANGHREHLDDSKLRESLKKVSFREGGEMDSGFGSTYGEVEVDVKTRKEEAELPVEEESVSEDEDEEDLQLEKDDKAVCTDSSLLFYKTPEFKRKELDERPRWRYWARPPGASEHGKPGGTSQKRVTAFRETAMEAPLEARAQPLLPEPEIFGPVNPSAVFGSVVKDIQGDRAQIEWLLKHQGSGCHVPQAPAAPAHHRIGRRDLAREAKEQGYLESRKRQTMEREQRLKQRETEIEEQKAMRNDQARLLHRERLQKDIERTQNEEQMISHTMETKKALTAQVMKRIDDYAERNREREQARREALVQRAQRRAEIQTQRQREIEETIERRQEIKKQNAALRWEKHNEKLVEQAELMGHRDDVKRQANVTRREHFRDIEKDNQQRKDLRIAVKTMKLQEYRSQVLP
ncbi:uncharacterized protein [Ptychodera flava]|uniref:uncharacterized protein n=1 Tax=Ptychodera flava TaxID=63121 RepID=UPI003969EE56